MLCIHFIFEEEKYGFQLLMDVRAFENITENYFLEELHTTNFFEMFVFENAQGQIDLNGHSLKVTDQTIFFISPYQKKRCSINVAGVKGFHLVFKDDFFSNFFDDKIFSYRLQFFYNSEYPQFLKLTSQEFSAIKVPLQDMVTEIKNFQNDSPHIMRSLLYFTLSKLNRLYSKQFKISSDTQSNTVVYKFKERMEEHIRQLHTVKEYAELLDISRHQLNAIAKSYFGKTAKQIIQNRLLQEIKIELQYTNKTINEIADHLNFSEANNLTRFFTKHESISPKHYRGNYQNDRN